MRSVHLFGQVAESSPARRVLWKVRHVQNETNEKTFEREKRTKGSLRAKPRNALPPGKSLAFQIRRAHLAFDRLLTMRLSRHGVKAGYWNYLRALWIADGITQRELSEITSVAETTTVILLKGMVEEGLVERVRDTKDRRKVYVRLTEKGRGLEPVLLPYAIELNKLGVQRISKTEVAATISVLERVAANLEAAFSESESD
jgi:MarR family transcriptional regulator, organic hydroperoxide resistance regulator